MKEEKRRRGPRKGEGGRPHKRLLEDDDRFLVFAAILYRLTLKDFRQLTVSEIKWLSMQFATSPNVGADFMLEAENDRLRFSFQNKSPSRAKSQKTEAGRLDTADPSRNAFWRSRIDVLRRKTNRYWLLLNRLRNPGKSTVLTDEERNDATWLNKSFWAIYVLNFNDPIIVASGLRSLDALGWGALPDTVKERLLAIFALISQAPENANEKPQTF